MGIMENDDDDKIQNAADAGFRKFIETRTLKNHI